MSPGKTLSAGVAKTSLSQTAPLDRAEGPVLSAEGSSTPTFSWSIGRVSLAAPDHDEAAPPIVHDVLRSAGQPLDAATRAFFKPHFGSIVSRVRLHADARAQQSAHDIRAQAYTVGRDIVFGSGHLCPGTAEGRWLLAHELAHVVQQRGLPQTVQRQPSPADPDAERDAAIKTAEAATQCTAEQVDEQADGEIRLKLDSSRRADPAYALTFGGRDKARVEKHGLSDKDQRDIAVKWRFFEGQAKAAYIRSMAAVLSNYPDEALEIMAPCATPEAAGDDTSAMPQATNTSDAGKRQFLLQYEGEPGKSRCMDVTTDPEYRNLFDANIVSAAGYAVPDTTWDNVDYDSFQLMVVKYRNGTSEYFVLDSVGNFYYGGKTLGLIDYTYFKRKDTGLIYPVVNGRIYFSEALTPRIIARKNGLRFQVKQLKDLYTLLQAAGSFAQIIALNSIAEDFKTSIEGLQKSRLSGFKSVKKGGGGGGGIEPSSGVPEPLPEDEPTGRVDANERTGEKIGDITIVAAKRLNGDTYEIDVWGLFGKGGRSEAKDSRKTTDIRNVMQIVRSFQAEGRASGARELKVRGLAITDKNILKDGVLKLGGLAKSLGGTARVTGENSIEIVIPLR